jgi:uncharacterized protein YjbJ (UPF0337 family)
VPVYRLAKKQGGIRTFDPGEYPQCRFTVAGVVTANPTEMPSFTTKEWCTMGAKSDQVKGHAEEAVGSLVGNKKLESEGRADRRAGEAKEKVDHAKDKVEEVIDKAKGALHRK